MSDSGTRVRRRLPSHPSSAGEARRMVMRVLSDAGRDDLLEPAQLLVSEVVTNALVHSGTAIDVSMAASGDGVLVEVGDGSEHIPRMRQYAVTASTGRGMALLDRTADAWGIVPGVHGKTVWFQLSSGDQGGGDPAAHDSGGAIVLTLPSGSTRGVVTVRLHNVPLLMHSAWQQYAEATLREYLLVTLDSAPGGGDPFSDHAAATDALAVLSEHIPRPDVGDDPDELMSSAVDPLVSEPLVEVPVPNGSVPHFGILTTMLDAAQELASRGQLLVPRVQPEMWAMRHWICQEVTRQAAGAAPIAWPPGDEPPPPRWRETAGSAWDPKAVALSPQALLAADDTDVILAVSPSAATLLGYGEPAELVGRRLITVIPDRYRQAHLAGFTLHLLTGRGPLLGTPVQVPALRRDGTEVVVDLTLQAQRVADGRSVFVAAMRDVSGG